MILRAGKLSMIYENGFLRYISAGDEEVLRMIYFAVRDTAWDTLPSEITQEKIVRDDTGFTITYTRTFHHGDIRMQWQVRIEGRANSELFFEIKGEALSSFQKNRAGLCILHPIKEHTGKEVLITHTDGRSEQDAFPTHISPHQPFMNIAAMEWRTGTGEVGKLQFRGEVFETEDQRNWTDDSYKTYCTPLDLPWPVGMQPGDEVHQSVHFTLTPAPLPAIGIGRPFRPDKVHLTNLAALSSIGFTHYRVEIPLSDPDWRRTLDDSLLESKVLHAPLEIALFMTDEDQLARFMDVNLAVKDIHSIIFLPRPGPTVQRLRERFPGIPIGSGTDSHFTDLNRSDMGIDDLDFVSYSIHPQVHAFDDATLMENARAQGYTVATARHKYGIPVHVTPVTLHDRHIVDPRLYTDLGARWTAASLDSLITAGAASITYFDTGIAGYPVVDVLAKAISTPSIS